MLSNLIDALVDAIQAWCQFASEAQEFSRIGRLNAAQLGVRRRHRGEILVGRAGAIFQQTAAFAKNQPPLAPDLAFARPAHGFLRVVASEQMVGILQVLLQGNGDIPQLIETSGHFIGRELRADAISQHHIALPLQSHGHRNQEIQASTSDEDQSDPGDQLAVATKFLIGRRNGR